MAIQTSLGIRDRMSQAIEKITRRTEKMNRALDQTEATTATAEAAMSRAKVADDFGKFQQNQNTGSADPFGGIGASAQKAGGQVDTLGSKLRTILSVTALLKASQAVMNLSDDMTSINARMQMLTGSEEEAAALQDKIMASAKQSRTYYLDTASAVAKLGVNARDAFSNTDELVAFSELVNKTFTISGATAEEQKNAMLQLTQAMSSGVLRGDELRSIFEQSPLLIQTIADYLDKPIGKIRDMAAEGLITSDVVKAAVLGNADSINERFNQMPMTWAQVWNEMKNIALEAFGPLIQTIGRGAQWVNDNWETLKPTLAGIATIIGVVAAAYLIYNGVKFAGAAISAFAAASEAIHAGATIAQAAATTTATGAQVGLNAAMMASPFTWLIIVIGLIIGLIVKWITQIGGLKMAWMLVCDAILTFTGNLKVGVLTALQGLVNGAIDIINSFIELLNTIPGVSIEAVGHVTWGTEAKLKNEAEKQARKADIAAYQQELADKKSQQAAGNDFDWDNIKVGEVGNVKNVEDGEVSIDDESLKYLRDVAEMRYVQNFVTLTPTVSMNANISEKVDAEEVVGMIESRLETEFSATAEGAYA